MAFVTAKMDALMAQLRTSRVEPMPRASAFASLQRELAYDPMSFLPLPQQVNPRGMWAPLRGMSLRATVPPYPYPTYTSKNITTITIDPLAPYNVLQDPMMSILNPTMISYIANMISRQV